MTASFDRLPGDVPEREGWEAEGRRVGEGLDDAHLVLVLGTDTMQTALAALGIARAQAAKRRVALGDLLGDAEPIHGLLDHDDPHGLVDSFLYGVSINAIARPVDGMGDLYVLPSGSEPPAYEEIFTNARWQRLANGFRETGALLVVAAPVDAAHVGDVVALGDGAVLVGDAELAVANPSRLLGRVTLADAPSPADATAVADARGVGEEPLTDGSFRASRPRFARLPAAAGILFATALVAFGVWLAARPFDRRPAPSRSTAMAAGALPSALDVAADSGAAATAAALPVAVNPADSATAAAYSVVLTTMNTQAGAIGWFQKNGRSLPAATFAPVVVRGTTWFRVLVGAYPNRAQADSLLGVLRANGELGAGFGEVVRAPYAFLVDSVRTEAVAGLLQYFADRGQPIYALRQADGSARLYAGAFETREQASLFVEATRSSDIRPVLVYRIGRVN